MKNTMVYVENFGGVLFENSTNVEVSDKEYGAFCEKVTRSHVKEVRDVTGSEGFELPVMSIKVDTFEKLEKIKRS